MWTGAAGGGVHTRHPDPADYIPTLDDQVGRGKDERGARDSPADVDNVGCRLGGASLASQDKKRHGDGQEYVAKVQLRPPLDRSWTGDSGCSGIKAGGPIG